MIVIGQVNCSVERVQQRDNCGRKHEKPGSRRAEHFSLGDLCKMRLSESCLCQVGLRQKFFYFLRDLFDGVSVDGQELIEVEQIVLENDFRLRAAPFDDVEFFFKILQGSLNRLTRSDVGLNVVLQIVDQITQTLIEDQEGEIVV
jgi:hypothetical protein